MSDLCRINEALQSENNSLKGVIECLNADKSALEQTVIDVLRANINLKSGAIILENRLKKASESTSVHPDSFCAPILEPEVQEVASVDHSLN